MSLTWPYWGHFTKVMEGLVTLLVSNVVVIHCLHYVGQKLKRFLYGMFPILVEGNLLHKSLNTTDLLSVDELPRSVQLYDFSDPVIFGSLDTKMETLAAGEPFL